MASFRAKLIDSALRFLQIRNIGNRVFHHLYPFISRDAKPPRRLQRHHDLTVRSIEGRPLYEIAPKGVPGSPHVYYLHGGAHFSGFLPEQWDFVDRLVSHTHCRMTAPDYPLTPHHRADDIFAVLLPLYREIIAATDPSEVVIFGDSSGGGLGLALIQMLRAQGIPLPGHLILSAPWLDVTMTNPEIQPMEYDDPFLGLKECIYAGQRYAGPDDPTDPKISPIYGNLKGLCPITLFVGTRDLMLPDCRKLKRLADEAGTPLNYREYEGMLHDWIMLRLAESQEALGEVAEILEGLKAKSPIREAISPLDCK